MKARLCLIALAVAACGKGDTPPADYQTPGAPAAAMPTHFTTAEFNHLRYLEGTWIGTMPNGNPFYESYHFINDSTILKGGHTDSTFHTKSDSSLIILRNGAVIDSGSTSSTAEKLDSTVVDFRSGPTYHFSWTREGPDAWTARLFAKQADGTERVTTYPMRRVRR
jgi:hypothetical protein